MKKLPVEKLDSNEIKFTFQVIPLDNSFVARAIKRYFTKINRILNRNDYWDNLKVLDKLIHHLRELTLKLEKRRTELLKKRVK